MIQYKFLLWWNVEHPRQCVQELGVCGRSSGS